MSFSRVQSTYNELNSRSNEALSILKNPYASAVLLLIFIGYASKAATEVPQRFQWVFEHPAFRITVLTLAVWTSSKNFTFSLAIVSAYIIFMHILTRRLESFDGMKTAIYPGCMSITTDDLIDAFAKGGDRETGKVALAEAMQQSVVPFSVVINDENAPLIATYLMNNNYKIKTPCAPPGTQ